MFKPGRLQRLLAFTLKPLLAALTLTLLIRSFSSSSPKSTINKGAKFHLSQHLIIASTTTSNLTWLTSLPSKNLPWKPHIYVTDTTTPPANTFTVPINKGNEAMAYLTYIIDNYRSLPDIMFFHHDHHQAWHQSFSSSFELSHLNPTTVLSQGYVSPRCLPGCENIIELSGDVVPLSDLRGTSRDVQIICGFEGEGFKKEFGGVERVEGVACSDRVAEFDEWESAGVDLAFVVWTGGCFENGYNAPSRLEYYLICINRHTIILIPHTNIPQLHITATTDIKAIRIMRGGKRTTCSIRCIPGSVIEEKIGNGEGGTRGDAEEVDGPVDDVQVADGGTGGSKLLSPVYPNVVVPEKVTTELGFRPERSMANPEPGTEMLKRVRVVQEVTAEEICEKEVTRQGVLVVDVVVETAIHSIESLISEPSKSNDSPRPHPVLTAPSHIAAMPSPMSVT
ncbi:hypothetical protein G7Y89_g13455 [Cudoniella acicularis]|uniref:Uncharacterized protein n=1 Tax=Cudoniella acicularis TaxID=354080 RepID=A0A8H4R9K3_9HELO|nr:hypothetical protein G7Y89_g13455 [Cudoniella acicularis]